MDLSVFNPEALLGSIAAWLPRIAGAIVILLAFYVLCMVMTIDLRYSELNSDNNKILIPNAKLFTDPVTVMTVPTE